MILVASTEPREIQVMVQEWMRSEGIATHVMPLETGDFWLVPGLKSFPETYAQALIALQNLKIRASLHLEEWEQEFLTALFRERAVLIERKTPNDFLESLVTGRLDDQVVRLRDAYFALILITGLF